MVRRRWLLVQVALLGVLGVLALPSSGSALVAFVPIYLTANGPSPAVQNVGVGAYPIWVNQDTAAHAVVFANGRCSLQIPPGGRVTCPTGFYAGDYQYTVDGTMQASLVVAADWRTVTLGARSHTIDRGSVLTLHGKLAVGTGSPPAFVGPRQPVTVLARPDRYHPFHRIAVVTARPRGSRNPGNAHSVWQLRVRPGPNKIYIAEANSQPRGGQYWQRALSRPFRVHIASR
jgi:hypothetical protein